MVREAIGIGETTDAALKNACQQLGLETYEVQFDILENAKKKTLGLFGGNPAKVRAYVTISPAQVAADYLKAVMKEMGVSDVKVEITEEKDGAVFDISGDDVGFIIGRHGETMDALQYLTGLVANHVDDSYYRITINTGNYREKREKTLEALAKRIAEKAIATNRKYSLEPMNPYERRIIHTTVQKMGTATSWSEGDDFNRHVVIGPADGVNAKYGRDSRSDGRRGGYGRRGGKRSSGKGELQRGSGYKKQDEAVASAEKREPKNDEAQAPLYGKIEINK